MRIISGQYKGRKPHLSIPKGIRPTQDAMRETIFNILNNWIDFEGKVAADVCAGAGMLGIEALSRGVEYVYFVDKNTRAIDYINNFLQLLKVSASQYNLINLDATQFIGHFNEKFFSSNNEFQKLDILFIDPPYKSNIISNIILQLQEIDIINPGGIIIIESGIDQFIPFDTKFELLTERQFGASKVIFYGQRAAAGNWASWLR